MATVWFALFPNRLRLETGDVLLTSGLDGTYPAGIPVATVSRLSVHRERLITIRN